MLKEHDFMKRWSTAAVYVLLAGTCIGFFFYTRTFPVIRFSSEMGRDSHILWAYSSLAQLGKALFIANLALLLVWIVYSGGYATFFKFPFTTILETDAFTYLPFCILAISLTQFNTFLVYHSDVFLLLSHNFGYFVFLAALFGVIYLKIHNHRKLQRIHPPLPASSAPPVQKPIWKRLLAIFVISFVIYGVAGRQIVARLPLGGDEPHYLLMSHSLLHDQDLAIGNNYNQHDYRAFFPGTLNKHLSIAKDGTRYSIHPLGVAFLLLPGYALGGRAGAVLVMNVTAALLAAVLYALAFALTRRHRIAIAIWGIASFTTPLLLYASQLYPEIPSALLLGLAYYLIRFQRPFSRTPAILFGLCLLLLPWFQQRMILPTIFLAGYYLYVMNLVPWNRQWKSQLSLHTLLPIIFLMVSGVCMAGYYYFLYGNPLPNAPYLSVGRTSVFSWEIFVRQGLFGLLFDQEAGLLLFSPYYIFLFPGFLLFFRRRMPHALVLFALILSIYIPCAGFVLQWRGAWSPAARYMVALIPLLIVPLSIGVNALTRPVYRYIFAFFASIGVFWTVHFLHTPMSSLMARGGINSTFEQQSNLVDLTKYFPSFSPLSTNDMALTGVWGLMIFLFTLFAYWSAQKTSFADRLSVPITKPLSRVFACYGIGAGILLFVSGIAVHTQNDAFSKWAKNEQILNFLSNFTHNAVFTSASYQQQPLSNSQFRLEYMSRERVGKVDEQQGARFLITGPRKAFPPGAYTAYFWLVVNPSSAELPVITIDIVANRGKTVFYKQTFFGQDFSSEKQGEPISVNFSLPPDVNDLETRVYFHNQERVLLKNIAIEPQLEDFYFRAALSALAQNQEKQAKLLFSKALRALRNRQPPGGSEDISKKQLQHEIERMLQELSL